MGSPGFGTGEGAGSGDGNGSVGDGDGDGAGGGGFVMHGRYPRGPSGTRRRRMSLTPAVEFAPMPLRIETERLILVPEEPGDADWLTELLNTRGTGTFTPADARERIAAMQRVVADLGIGVRVIRPRATGRPVGYCGIVIGRGSVEEPELAYELLPEAHGRGYATEAARAVLDAAFATGRTRIWATVGAWNAPSFRVLDKLGFRRDHTGPGADGDVVWLIRDR